MIILVDNYDSFTYNLYQLLGEIGEKVIVFRNDEINKETVQELSPDAIVISPGPCTPNQAGKSMEIIDVFSGKIPRMGNRTISRWRGRACVLASENYEHDEDDEASRG